LGEKLVSGTITPDTYIINKTTDEVVEKYVLEDQILDGEKLRELSMTVKKIEKTFCFAVDVEWSYTDEELFILQSRPITTLG
jgi:phosphoenolpyruvate synthase/pyruvate phosphate dikinase